MLLSAFDIMTKKEKPEFVFGPVVYCSMLCGMSKDSMDQSALLFTVETLRNRFLEASEPYIWEVRLTWMLCMNNIDP